MKKRAKHQKSIPVHLQRFTKQALDLMRQEIFAVLAVAVLCLVLVLAYSHSAGQPGRPRVPSTGGTTSLTGIWSPDFMGSDLATILPPSALMLGEQLSATTNLGDILFADDTTIYFGSTIKGYNREGIETWATEIGIQNHGSYIQVIRDNQVVIAGITNGNHTLWVTGKGTITVNGINFVFRTLDTLKKVIGVTNNTLTIKLKAGSQIYTISTLSPDTDIPVTAETTAVIAKILMIPSKSTVTLTSKGTAVFKPIVILTDQSGKQITNTANLLSWSSSNPTIATVGATGIVTVTKTGTVTITATVTGSNLSATIYLTVKAGELSPLIDLTPAGVKTASEIPKDTAPKNLWERFIDSFHR